jgi:C4-dicarboxylate-specific signal transduction histidine kinase
MILATGLVIVVITLVALVAGLLAERHGRLLAEAEAREALRELAFMNRRAALGELSASIAHDLNQPLGAVLNNANAAALFLDATPPDLEEVRGAVTAIAADAARAGEIVRRVRTLLSRHPLERGTVNVRRLVDEVVALLRPEATRRHVTITSEVFGSPVVDGDETHLRQVLINVCLNAVEAMRAGATGARALTVSAVEEDGQVVLRVADTGPGFTPEAAARAFEAFYTTKASASGMGIGLAIAHRVIDAHGGTISVANNTPHAGATVTIALPRHTSA